MARSFVIELIDDLDGSEAMECVHFGLDGTHYNIDLGQQNADELRAVLVRFVKAGRRVDGSRRRAVSARPAPAKTGTGA